jgi:hypothetical protein
MTPQLCKKVRCCTSVVSRHGLSLDSLTLHSIHYPSALSLSPSHRLSQIFPIGEAFIFTDNLLYHAIITIIYMLVPLKQNSFTRLRVLLVLTDRGILAQTN